MIFILAQPIINYFTNTLQVITLHSYTDEPVKTSPAPGVSFSLSESESITAAAAKSLQSCPTLCDPIDGSPLGSPVPGILQARTLEWVAISFSDA